MGCHFIVWCTVIELWIGNISTNTRRRGVVEVDGEGGEAFCELSLALILLHKNKRVRNSIKFNTLMVFNAQALSVGG